MIKYVKIYDLIGFKICWILCASCSVWSMPYLGPLVTLIFILIHLKIVNFDSTNIKIIILAIFLGLIIDSLFFRMNLIEYSGGFLAEKKIAPLWILSMWAGFSVTLIYTLQSLRENLFLSSILGIIGGPLSYSAGVQIGSITIHNQIAYIFLSIAWGLVVPLIFLAINKFNKNV